MGAIGGMLGLGGGAGGTGYDKPQLANIERGVTATDVGNSLSQNQSALNQQQALVNTLATQQGIQNQSDVYNNLKGVAAGTGPNPAQAMLNQQTGANVANQAALMAGQRGAGANAGLMARQAAQQGANTQQQAVGQGATMQANQSLGALNQMGGIAGTQVANQIGAYNSLTQAQQNHEANLLGALGGQNSAAVSNQGNVNSANASLAGQGMQNQSKAMGGLGGAIGSITKLFADGGQVAGPSSFLGQSLMGASPSMNSGGMVDVMLSPGEKVIPPDQVNEAAGGKVQAKTVPGEAKISGDSTKNDTYKTKLPEGSVVVPRTKSKDTRDAAAFVRAVLSKRGKR